jgi:hypothetical protein
MADREKVIKGIDVCLQRFHCGEDCPYFNVEFGCMEQLREDALSLLKEQEERIAIMRESMDAMEKRLAAAEGKLIEVKSIDQMVDVGWMHEDQKLGLRDGDL